MRRKPGRRTKFEDTLTLSRSLDPEGPAQAGYPEGSLTNRLNVPVVRGDRVWLDRSHKVRCPDPRGSGHGPPVLTSVKRAGNQASNESLILAQNQRWRRA